MGTCMTRQEAEGQPTTVDILGRGRHEATHIMAPEGETTQSKAQSTTQVTQQTRIRRSRITTPVEGIPLRASPSRTRPDDAVTRILALYSLPKRLVVAQRIEVVLIESALAAMIETIVRCCLAEVALDGRDTLFQQACNLRLIPTDGLRIREVEHGVLVWHTASGIRHVQTFLDDLWEETVLRRKVRQLPQTGVETVLCQLLQHFHQHFHRILEAILGKLIVTLPIDAKPARIEVYHVRRYLVGPQLTGNLESFLLREIGDTAHPSTETPERQHRRLASDVGIFVEDGLWFSEEHEEVHLLVGHEQTVGSDVAGAKVACHRSRGMHEDTIAARDSRRRMAQAYIVRRFLVLVGR